MRVGQSCASSSLRAGVGTGYHALAHGGVAVAFDATLAARLRPLLPSEGSEEKRMFGGLCFFLNGHIVLGVWGESLIVRLGADEAEASLRDARVKPFAPAGKAMTGWVLVAPEALADELPDWVRLAVRFNATLPPK
ncbi:MAG: TfoX/Sxy family protein [Gemmataceae bacterium]|nr:TfoX/Sxy family protein [Gemmataceae bacterium]